MTIKQRMALTLKSEKIVGGREVENMRNWAFIGNLGGYCGGSLIGDSWFLTAGHCCASTPLGKKVYFGVLNPWEDKGRVERRVVAFENHPLSGLENNSTITALGTFQLGTKNLERRT